MVRLVHSGFADGVRLDSEQVRLALQKAPALLAHNVKKAMTDIAAEHTKRVKTRFKSWTWGEKPVPEIQLRNGDLRRAVGPPHFTGTNLSSLLMTQVVNRPANARNYAEIQETGGSINAKRKRLTVPLQDTLDKRGMILNKYRIVRGGVYKRGPKKGTTGWQTREGIRTFLPKKGDKTYVAIKQGKDDVKALYLLRNVVRLRPRLQFGATWREMGEFQQKALNLALERTVAAMTGGA